MTLPARARELRLRLRQSGWRGTATFVGARLRAQLREEEPLLVLVKDLDEIVEPARAGRVRVEPLERRHLPALSELNRERGDDGGDARFASDVEAGYRGLVAYVGDDLVGCYWWAERGMPEHRDMRELGLGIALGEHDAYGFDLYVDKAHRAGGTAADFLFQVETALREQGARRVWGYVVERNRLARWLYDARGYRPMWRVNRVRRLRRWSQRIEPIEQKGAVAA